MQISLLRGFFSRNSVWFEFGIPRKLELWEILDIFFWSLPRPVLDFEFNEEDLGRSEQIGPSNTSF